MGTKFHTGLIDTDTHSAFNEKLVAAKTSLIELKSIYGISNLRDVTTITGNAAITNDSAEYKLALTADGDDSAILDSAERARYIPGRVAEAGIGIRLDKSELAGNQVAKWGYFDGDDGFYFGIDNGGLFVAILKDGTEVQKTYQSEWIGDRLDGSDESGMELDPKDGHIYQIRFTWYGYGGVEFRVSAIDENIGNLQTEAVVHRFSPLDTEGVTINNPNLPLRVSVDNNGTAQAVSVFTAGRQFSIFGSYRPNTRISAHRVVETSVAASTSGEFTPLITVRRKSGFSPTSVKFQGLDIITDSNLIYQIRTDVSLSTSASFGALTDVSTGETSLEADTSSTSSSGGEFLFEGLVAASGQGGNSLGSMQNNNFRFDLINQKNATLLARTIDGSSAAITSVLRLAEEW